MRKLLLLALVLLLGFALAFGARAESAVSEMEITVLDRASLLTPEEVQYFTTLQGTPAKDVRLFLITANRHLSEYEVAALCGADQGVDAAVLLLKLIGGTYYYEMFLYNEADKMMTRAESDAILDDPQVYDNLKGGRLQLGTTRFFELCADEINEWHRQRPLWIIGVGVGVGLLVGGISVFCTYLAYRRKRHGESYPLDRYAKLDLTERADIFVGSFVTRTRVQSSSGSSGGGFGGGGGGGFSGGSRGGR